jgi:hypothetical protein
VVASGHVVLPRVGLAHGRRVPRVMRIRRMLSQNQSLLSTKKQVCVTFLRLCQGLHRDDESLRHTHRIADIDLPAYQEGKHILDRALEAG